MELVADTATLYVTGSLGQCDVDMLIAMCAAAPPGARTLRLDLHGVGHLGPESVVGVRRLLRFWRDTRHGDFHLAASHVLATVRETQDVRAPTLGDWHTPQINDALAATYL